MSPEDFEALYRRSADPWSYESSPYERAKYEATLQACGPGPHHEGLELGSSIGVMSASLAGRCRHLTTVEGAATAVVAARRRLGGRANVDIVHGTIPRAIPKRAYDLVVVSEVLYYLQPDALMELFVRLRGCCAQGARVVAVHWRPAGPERPFSAAEVHTSLHAQPWLSAIASAHRDDYLLDTFITR